MKIGVLTYFWAENFGMFAQAVASVRALKRVAPDAHVELIDIRHWDTNRSIPPGLKCLLKGRFGSFAKHYTRWSEFRKAIDALPKSSPTCNTTNRAESIDYLKAQNYDLIVVGADVILKYVDSPDVMDNLEPPIYWLPEDLGVPHVMLASAASVTNLSKLTDQQADWLRKSAQGYSMLAIRDELTRRFIVELDLDGDPRLKVVPDPTLTLEIDHGPADELWKKIPAPSDKPAIGIRLHNTPFVRELIQRLRDDYFIVSFVADLPGVHYDACQMGPYQWQGIFKHLSGQITMSFHDTLFSLKHDIPPILIDESMRVDPVTGASKNMVLYESLGLTEHYFNPVKAKINTDDVKALLDRVVKQFDPTSTQQWLKNGADLYCAAAKEACDLAGGQG